MKSAHVATFRRRDTKEKEFDAEQYLGDVETEGVCQCKGDQPHVHTGKGGKETIDILPGDWLVPDGKGKLRPLNDEQMTAQFKRVSKGL